MEQKLVCDDRLDVARRLYRALCAYYPNRFITLFDADGACVAAHSGRPVTLLYAARDETHNNAVTLKAWLERLN